MPFKLKIGTRESKLAQRQAESIQASLSELDILSEIVFIKTEGDQNLITPLYEMGVEGIFTKALDIALLNNEIDIAVHSLKDVPTQLANGLTIAAIPKRGNPMDVLVYKDQLPGNDVDYLVATSSLRRSAQWLHRFPGHSTTVLRGNINTRLKKLHDQKDWCGALFAAAGIERINLEVPNKIELNWMIPAPAQGALGVIAREADHEILAICAQLNDAKTAMAVTFERGFLRKLMGGCSMPIGGLAVFNNDQLHFEGCILTRDGEEMSKVEITGNTENMDALLDDAVTGVLKNGGAAIVANYKK